MTEEGKVQRDVLDYLIREDGWFCNKLMAMSHAGWPDIIAIKNGKTLFVEVKKKGEKPNTLQDYTIKMLNNRGAIAIYVDSIEMLYEKLNLLKI